jgi:hypothetical protein
LGLVRAPRFVPPWVSDPRSLFALLTVSSITSRIDLTPMSDYAGRLLASVPPTQLPPP